jgi:hypothetical protein
MVVPTATVACARSGPTRKFPITTLRPLVGDARHWGSDSLNVGIPVLGPAQFAIHALDGGANLVGNLFYVSSGHFQFRVPKLCLDVARPAVFLEMCGACAAKSLVRKVANVGLRRQWSEAAFEIVAETEWRASLVWKQQI